MTNRLRDRMRGRLDVLYIDGYTYTLARDNSILSSVTKTMNNTLYGTQVNMNEATKVAI